MQNSKQGISSVESIINALLSSLGPQALYRYAINMLNSIEICSCEQNLDKKIQILKSVNSYLLAHELQLSIPSLVTDDYIDSALFKLETMCRQMKWAANQDSGSSTILM